MKKSLAAVRSFLHFLEKNKRTIGLIFSLAVGALGVETVTDEPVFNDTIHEAAEIAKVGFLNHASNVALRS